MCISIQAHQVTMNSIPPLHDNNAPLPGSSPTVEYNDLRFAASSIPTGFTRLSEDSSASGTSNTKKNNSKFSKSPRSPRKKPTKASSSRSIKSNGSTSNTTNDDDRPKRPLSAYNIFFQHEREMIMQGRDPEDEWPGEHDEASNAIILKKVLARSKSSQPTGPKKKREHVRTHGKIGFVQLAKTVGAKWKKLDESSRSVYVALASLERKRYKKEMAAWEKQKAAEKKTTPQDIKLPTAVEAKKPASKIQQAQACHFARVMAGGASIFDCQDGEKGNEGDGYYYEDTPPLPSLPTPSTPTHAASYSTQYRQQYHHHQQQQQQQQHQEQHYHKDQQLPPYAKINHSDLMAKCRAELATYADTSLRSIGTEVSDLTHPEYDHSYPAAGQPVTPAANKAVLTTTTSTMQEAAPTCWEQRHNDSASSIESLMSDFFDGPDSLDLALDELEKADLPPPPSIPYKVDDTMHQTARRLSMLTVSAETATKTNNDTTTTTTTRHVSLATAVAAQVEPNFYGGDFGGPSDADLLAFLSDSKIGELEVDPSKFCKHGQDDLKTFLNWAFDEQDKSLCQDD